MTKYVFFVLPNTMPLSSPTRLLSIFSNVK